MGGSGVLRSCSSRLFSLGALLPLQWIHLAAVLLLSYLLGVSWCWCSTLLAAMVAGPPRILRGTGSYSLHLLLLTSTAIPQPTPPPLRISLCWGWLWWGV